MEKDAGPFKSSDETWRGEAEVEEPSVATSLVGEAAKALVVSSHCGALQPQDEPLRVRFIGVPIQLRNTATNRGNTA